MDGIAREIISGFLRSEGQYDEAFKCLQERYHRRREIIKQHSLALVDIQIMKEADSNNYTARRLNILELSKNWDSK